jgi:hypothetical protein
LSPAPLRSIPHLGPKCNPLRYCKISNFVNDLNKSNLLSNSHLHSLSKYLFMTALELGRTSSYENAPFSDLLSGKLSSAADCIVWLLHLTLVSISQCLCTVLQSIPRDRGFPILLCSPWNLLLKFEGMSLLPHV